MMDHDVSNPPALVFGSGITALGVIRILGRQGIPTLVVGDNLDLVRNSRWFRAAPPFVPGMSLDNYLNELPLPIGVPISCSDNWTMSLATLSSSLKQRFLTNLPQSTVLNQLINKGQFAKSLEKLAVPHPLTISLDDSTKLASVPDFFFNSAFLKPCNSQEFFRHFGVKGFWVKSRADAEIRLEEIHKENLSVILQEYVPGPAHNHYLIDGFIDSSGQVIVTFARRRLRMHPVDFGNSTFMVSVDRDDAAPMIEMVTQFLTGIGYWGIFSAEFKLDERDGIFKILEINARPWWYVEFAAYCGIDVVTMAYKNALGLNLDSIGDYAIGKKMVYPYYDYSACQELMKRNQLTARGWAKDWIGAWQPVFKWDDPFPHIISTWQMASRIWKRK